MHFPFFTATDPKLIRADASRDPLGLLPVWSYFGRQLVPCLAGPVEQSKGIIAVLLIYYLRAEVLDQDFEQYSLTHREYFRLMEGLVEWHLQRTQQHCYGTLAFKSGQLFVVEANDASSAVNGLYQYYRGTCRNARLLSADWQLAPDAVVALGEAWPAAASKQLRIALKKSGRARRWVPAEVLDSNPALQRALNAVFSSAAMNQLLFDTLLGEEAHVQLAAHLAQLLPCKPRLLVQDIETLMREDVSSALLPNLRHIAHCEPFLMAVQDYFDYLRASANDNIANVAAALTDYGGNVQQRAADFLRVYAQVQEPNSRIDQLRDLAQAARLGNSALLQCIVQHHGVIAADRERDALLLIEADQIIVLSESERDKAKIRERLETRQAEWDNGYYLTNAGRIYLQLAEGIHA